MAQWIKVLVMYTWQPEFRSQSAGPKVGRGCVHVRICGLSAPAARWEGETRELTCTEAQGHRTEPLYRNKGAPDSNKVEGAL